MRLKSYFSETVEAAISLAREELGPEAMLVHSKRTTAEARRLGQYEIVFALQESQPAPASPVDRLSVEIEELKKRIEKLSGVMASTAQQTASRSPRRAHTLIRSLIEAEVYPDLAESIARDIGDKQEFADAFQKQIERLVRMDPSLGVENAPRKIVAMVGPPGSGKTTALVKLAIRYGVTARCSMQMISTDVFRVGAAGQLRLYASILGVGFQAVESALALAQALEEHRNKDLIFIDTPAWAPRDAAEIQELAAYIGDDREIDVHLVLPASNRASDLARTVGRYAPFRPSKLLYTRLDETTRHGTLINESFRTGKPVSFLTAGERIPDDLEPATAKCIAELLVGSCLAPDSADTAKASEEFI